ncbi:MAG: metal-dependent transcriptional regulator [Promethearchaeota archaeon]
MSNLNESSEDYLKAIYFISKKKKGGWCSNREISKYLDVKPSSVTGMLHKLKENGLIIWSPRKSLRLTEKGKNVAQETIDCYNILKNFFSTVLKIEDHSLIEELSCGIEHHITPEILESLQGVIFGNSSAE